VKGLGLVLRAGFDKLSLSGVLGWRDGFVIGYWVSGYLVALADLFDQHVQEAL
jgi:hypothetical protein